MAAGRDEMTAQGSFGPLNTGGTSLGRLFREWPVGLGIQSCLLLGNAARRRRLMLMPCGAVQRSADGVCYC